jgi:hypothetical protein
VPDPDFNYQTLKNKTGVRKNNNVLLSRLDEIRNLLRNCSQTEQSTGQEGAVI